jgi:NDP-sugar pyrophosphorylase family protein
MKAVILAAGKGSRLLPYSKIMPKALMPIELNSDNSFRSVIERLIFQIVSAKITDIFIVVNYKADLIKCLLNDGSDYNCRIKYVFQDVLDGNAGAFYRCQNLIGDEDVLIADCDNYFPENDFIKEMVKKHKLNKTDITFNVARVKDISKFAIIKEDGELNPIDIIEKPRDSDFGNLAKGGIIILSNRLSKLDKSISKIDKSISKTDSLELYTTTQIVKYCIQNKSKYKMQLCLTPQGFNDIGTWEEYIPLFKKNLNLKVF